ncbi:MAG TPA: NUDIX hydrolase [Candidatus Baltobacteraceae bacterium]|nr:NUDIX hydrolase [Candidatus Baltobacteraceae bacterium]
MNNAGPYRVRVSAAVLRPGDELLVVRESHMALAVVNLPGGAPQIGETLERAVVREVLEETGYEVVPTEIAFVAEKRSDRYSSSALEVCFYARIASRAQREPVSGDGVQVVEWLPLGHADLRRHLPHTALFAQSKRGRYIDQASRAETAGYEGAGARGRKP